VQTPGVLPLDLGGRGRCGDRGLSLRECAYNATSQARNTRRLAAGGVPGSCETGVGAELMIRTHVLNKGGHGVSSPLDGPELLGRSWRLAACLSEGSRATLGLPLDLCRPAPPR